MPYAFLGGKMYAHFVDGVIRMNHCIVFWRAALVVLAQTVLVSSVAAQTTDQQAPATAAEAKAQFDQHFKQYGETLREIEKLRTDYQTAGASGRKTINFQLSEKLAVAKQQLDAMIAAGLDCYRSAPKDNPQLGQLLVSVAKYYVAGECHRIKVHQPMAATATKKHCRSSSF